MITSKGKSIIAKFLISETDSYASYIAIGGGATPIESSTPFSNEDRLNSYSKTEMDLEMLRVPITSKGFIVENDSIEISAIAYLSGTITYTTSGDHLYVIGQRISVLGSSPEVYDVEDEVIVARTSTSFSVLKTLSSPGLYVGGATAHAKVSKVVLTAELPTTERYEFSEVGIYPAEKNPDLDAAFDSRMLFSFSRSEDWELHQGSTILDVEYQAGAIDEKSATNRIDPNNSLGKSFFASSSNSALLTSERSSRYERPRYLEDSVFIRGDLSPTIQTVGGSIDTTDAEHIHLSTLVSTLSRATPKDIIKVAFSVLSRDAANVLIPDNTKLSIEFLSDDSNEASNYAKMDIEVVNTDSVSNSIDNYIEQDMSDNRYVVYSSTLDKLSYSQNFSWDAVNIIKISALVLDPEGENSNEFYIGLDAIRFENMSSENPLYGLVGYSVLKNKNSMTIAKDSNKSGFIEFRYSVDVG